MKNRCLSDICSVNTNFSDDTFVGIKCENNTISVCFPLGYDLSLDEKELRKDVLALIDVIRITTAKKDSYISNNQLFKDVVDFPIQAYLHIIRDFIDRGYYIERDVEYDTSQKGKVSWSRTIKTQKPHVSDGNVFYLNLVTKKAKNKDNELISLIHEYCVYESFEKIGWLYTSSMPKIPRIRYKKKLFANVIKNKLQSTFNDRNRRLFESMLAMILALDDDNEKKDYQYGTYRFEYVWESLIDKVFGINDKEKFFPNTYWQINGNIYANSFLEPDTIMVKNNNIYILDAKYYKFGATKNYYDLPGTSSIAKQITYGEYVYSNENIKKEYGSSCKVYNAFIMPFSKEEWGEPCDMICIGNANSDWKKGDYEYEKVQGILLDVKTFIRKSISYDEVEQLVALIENS